MFSHIMAHDVLEMQAEADLTRFPDFKTGITHHQTFQRCYRDKDLNTFNSYDTFCSDINGCFHLILL